MPMLAPAKSRNILTSLGEITRGRTTRGVVCRKHGPRAGAWLLVVKNDSSNSGHSTASPLMAKSLPVNLLLQVTRLHFPHVDCATSLQGKRCGPSALRPASPHSHSQCGSGDVGGSSLESGEF